MYPLQYFVKNRWHVEKIVFTIRSNVTTYLELSMSLNFYGDPQETVWSFPTNNLLDPDPDPPELYLV